MSWSYGTVGAIHGYVLSVDGQNEFADDGYYAAVTDERAHGNPGDPWRSSAIYPGIVGFDTFFYSDGGADLAIAAGYAANRAAANAAATEASHDTNPNSNREFIYATRVIAGFIEYPFGPSAGLYVLYSYIIVDPYGTGGPAGIPPPGFVPSSSPGGTGPLHGTDPPPQIPGKPGPPPPPPTKPPGVTLPGDVTFPAGMKYPCINDDGTMTEVDDPDDCPPITPLSDAIDDFPIDIIEVPVDTEDGQLVTWQPAYPAGIDRPNAIFAWDRAPRNLQTIDSLDDGQQTINEIVAVGAQVDGVNLTVTVRDQDSIDAIGRYWSSENFSFATDISTLTVMANARLKKYRMGAHVVTFEPSPGSPSLPKPWADFDISDTVRVKASGKLRGGLDPSVTTIFSHTLDVQRVNGWDLDLDDDTDAEKLVKLYTEEDLG